MDDAPHGAGADDAAEPRQALVELLKQRGVIRSPQVEAAFRAVPRHIFLPGVPLDDVYRDEAIATRQIDGVVVSSSSQPGVMASMIEQLQLEPGQRVLEVGAGTGYNAGLIAHIVGEAGEVVTVDLDLDEVNAAREHLAAAGLSRVRVVQGDGALGYAAAGPYNHIIVTAGASDIFPAWWDQLRPGGRLVLPLSFNVLQMLVAFQHAGDRMLSVSVSPVGFIRLRGASVATQDAPTADLEPGASRASQSVDPDALIARTLYIPRTGLAADPPQSTIAAPPRLIVTAYPPGVDYIARDGAVVVRRPWSQFVLEVT